MISWSISIALPRWLVRMKACGQFFARVSVVRLKLEHAQIKRDGFLHLLRGGEIIGSVLQDRSVARSQRECLLDNDIYFL